MNRQDLPHPETMEVNIGNCARCEDTHPLTFYKFFGKPIVADGKEYSWWGYCPNTGDPILLASTIFQEDDFNSTE